MFLKPVIKLDEDNLGRLAPPRDFISTAAWMEPLPSDDKWLRKPLGSHLQ